MALNPNAREFVPTTRRSSSPATHANAGDVHELSTVSDNGKEISDKTGTSDICTSDEGSRRYWDVQLPDDILTPDDDFFLPAREDEESVYHAFKGKEPQGVASISSFDFPHHSHQSPPRNSWEDELALPSMGGSWNGQLSNGPNHLSALSLKFFKEHSNVDALSFLASEFPSLPVQSLADVYQSNRGDLSLTVHMLTQCKLQDDGSTWRNAPSPSHSSPDSRSLHFFAAAGGLPNVLEEFDMHQARKSSRHWPYGRNGFMGDLSLGPSNFSLMSPYRSLLDEEAPFFNDESFEPTPFHPKRILSPRSWMESDNATLNLMLELREEAESHSHMRNFCIERARQATYAGNRIHAKDATAKGQYYNRLMKAAQNKLAEIELPRNMSTIPAPSFGPTQMHLVDLCGFHVNEAINILRRELSTFRIMSRSSGQRQQVFISVGTGHARGARMPARVLFAVKRHLVEEELLSFTEPQAGVVKVVVG